jgi:E3 ubiquitin ligase
MVPVPFWAGLSMLAGPWLFWRSFRDLRTRRLIENTPTARIRSMAMGLVEVQGAVSPRSTCLAPFSGRECAFWQVEVATQGRRGVWTTMHRNQSGHPFYLHDDTGTALVYPQGARCTLTFAKEEECNGLALPDVYAAYFHDQHLRGSTLWRMGRLRFRERALEDGEAVYVLGTAQPRPHAVDLSGEEALAATRTDDRAEKQARRLRIEDSEAVAVIRRGDTEPTFIISQQSERVIAFQLGLRAYAELLGGPALTLLGLGYWLTALHAGRWVHP